MYDVVVRGDAAPETAYSRPGNLRKMETNTEQEVTEQITIAADRFPAPVARQKPARL